MRLHKHDELVEAMALGMMGFKGWGHAEGSSLHTTSLDMASKALDALLEAAVRLEVAREASAFTYESDDIKEWTAETADISESMWADKLFPAIILRMEASDDK